MGTLSGKRILITDYYEKDQRLYDDILKILFQEGAHIFALLNATTLKSGFSRKYPRLVPIVLNSFRKYEAVDGEEVQDKNNIQFEVGPERRLMDNLPAIDHVVNFAGPKFVQVFTAKKERPKYRIIDTEFGKIRSKLRSNSFISLEFPHTVVHIVPDLKIGDTLRESFGKVLGVGGARKEKDKHYVKAKPATETESCEIEDRIEDADDDFIPGASTLTRISVLRRSLSFRVRRSFATRVMGDRDLPCSISEQKEELLKDEVEKLRRTLTAAYTKSVEKYERKRRKYLKNQEKAEEKLSRKVKSIKNAKLLENAAEIESANAATESRVGGILSESTVSRIKASRERAGAKEAARAATRAYNVQSTKLEENFQAKLKELDSNWYTDLLIKEAKIVRKVTKSYIEKIRAAEMVLK